MTINTILIVGAAYLGYKILEERRPLPPVQDLSGSTPNSDFKSIPEVDFYQLYKKVPFEDMDKKTCDVMLRGFAEDYTAPRMIQTGYDLALMAANNVGAPIAWTQYIVSKKQNEDYKSIERRAISALAAADSYILSGGRDLREMRNIAISSAIE